MKPSPISPWQVYAAIYADYPVSVFLDSVTFQKPNQRHSLIGYDLQSELKLSEKDLLRPGALKRLRGFLQRAEGTVFGYFGYEAAQIFDTVRFRKKKLTGYPAVYLAVFKKVLRFDHKLEKWDGKPPALAEKKDKEPFLIQKLKPEISKASFLKKVHAAKAYIQAGDIYQANLSQKFLFDYRGSPLSIYRRLRRINPSPFSSFFKIHGLQIASSSPERLIQKRGRYCETRPIAGTCPRNERGAAGKNKLNEWRRKLLGSSKEKAEHLMLVDLERNDLGRVCDFKTVKVEEFMTIEKYSHVVHLVSSVTGRLRKNKTALELLGAMFPGGTITGCPKIHCMEIIDQLEPSKRGLYTGSIGYFEPNGDMDWNIVIRTLIFKNGKGSFQVGAGIVYDSDPEREYKETLAKGEALTRALAETNR